MGDRDQVITSPPAGGGAAGWDRVITSLPVGVAVVDDSGRVVTANPRCAALLGLTPAQLRSGARPREWTARDDTGARAPDLADLAEQVRRCAGSLTIAIEAGVPGATHQLWADLHPLDAHRVALVVRPVEGEPARAGGLLDPLTGLPGRALLYDRIGQALAGPDPRALVLADVRGLGAVNTRLGFASGDRLLTEVAARLRAGFGTAVARYAGGTFAVLASGAPQRIADRAVAVAGRPLDLDGTTLHPAFRVGWAASGKATTDRTTVHGLVTAAEAMLGRG